MNETQNGGSNRGRWQFLLIVALFTVPLLVAVGWYVLAPRTAPAPSAHGTLIDPAQSLEAFELAVGADAAPFTLDDLRGHWSLLHVIDEACNDACGQRLYYTRQIRAALGRDRQRVQRIVLARGGESTPGLQRLLEGHPRLRVLAIGAERPLRRQLPADLDAATILLIDPLGNLMLRFGPAVEPDGILEDLEKLLKLSRVG